MCSTVLGGEKRWRTLEMCSLICVPLQALSFGLDNYAGDELDHIGWRGEMRDLVEVFSPFFALTRSFNLDNQREMDLIMLGGDERWDT